MSAPYPCPCCGHLVFADPPGSEDICMICFWEDDATQLRFPTLADATNLMSLADAQRSYIKLGAIDERFVEDVRKPTEEEPLDHGFRPITEHDSFEDAPNDDEGPAEPTQLYYWRPTFWRSAKPA
jgi:hypothetical protein